MGAARWLVLPIVAGLWGCADDLDTEDPFREDRRDDEVVDPPTGARATCAGLDGTFTSDEVLLLGRTGQRVELEEGALVATFDAGAGTFSTTLDGGGATAGDFAVFADRIILSAPLFDGITEGGALDCAEDDALRLRGPVIFDFAGDTQGPVLADLDAVLLPSP